MITIMSRDEKLLIQLQYPWEAEQLKARLMERSIECSVVQGSREYTQIILGGLGNPVLIYVAEKDFELANQILKSNQ